MLYLSNITPGLVADPGQRAQVAFHGPAQDAGGGGGEGQEGEFPKVLFELFT